MTLVSLRVTSVIDHVKDYRHSYVLVQSGAWAESL